MALSVQTPAHLFGLGLLEEVVESDEADINFLLQQAMERVRGGEMYTNSHKIKLFFYSFVAKAKGFFKKATTRMNLLQKLL